ncbi:MAG TPA: nucleoside 2-deoxyribosyltransferase [Anaerolineae bacterium]|nr:nucleoside 2-deoxyribosyltransferase [Anaerolineae bacterium]
MNANATVAAKVYVSGPLTSIDISTAHRLKQLYVAIGDLCWKSGYEAYVPHTNGTDPIANPQTSPSQVFRIDKEKVQSSDLLIAYVNIPSLGVGMELAYAESCSIPIILLYERGARISRFVLGIPSIVAIVEFADFDDALRQIENQLVSLRPLPKRSLPARMS